MYKKLFHLVLFILVSISARAQAAVILQYHHVSETLPAVTSVSANTFTKHLSYLKEHNFNVIPLNELISALQQGETLPDKTAAATRSFSLIASTTGSLSGPELPIQEVHPYPTLWNPILSRGSINPASLR